MTGGSLRTCSRCGRRFSVTLWQMHAHNPERLPCSEAACGEGAVGHCADDPLQQGLGPLCGPHLVEHRRWGHDVRFVDGGVCTVCDGRRRVPDPESPGGPWVRCSGCQGTGYASEQALNAQRRRAAERERERAEEEEARRREQEAREREVHAEDRERPRSSTDELSAVTDGAEQATDARVGQAEPVNEAEGFRRASEERLGEAVGEQGAGAGQEAVCPPPSEAPGERSQAAGGDCVGSEARIRAYPRATRARRRSPNPHRCCCLLFLIPLIAGIAMGGYHYWPSVGQNPQPEPLPPTPTATAGVAVEAVPTPTLSPSPVPTATPTPTPTPCADPTPTPTPTVTPAPTATPTPAWPPQPLSDAWRGWVPEWSRPQVDAALQESIAAFDTGLDDLGVLPFTEACRRAAAFEVRLEIARHLVDAHWLEHEAVPGQHAGISWVVWLRFQRELMVEAVRNHAPVAECRSLLAASTPTATVALASAPSAPEVTAAPLPTCPKR